jgi:pimeloyl-ACP methyl ester carboxylesterase
MESREEVPLSAAVNFAAPVIIGLLALVVVNLCVLRRRQQQDKAETPPGQYISAGSQSVHVMVAGRWQPHVPVVVFSGGTGLSSVQWMLVQQAVSKHTLCVAFDRAGLGFSQHRVGPRTVATAVAELRDVLTALELTATPVILVGHSLGTAVSQCYAALYAAHVRGLVLLDPIDRVSDLPQLDAAQALQVAAALVPTHRCVDSIAEQPIVTATSAGPDVSPPPSPLLDATAIVAAPAAASLHSAWLPGVTAALADTHVADELALDAEYAHAGDTVFGDCDVTVPGHEAQSARVLQLTVAAAFRPEATKKSTVTALEHTDAVGIGL